MQGETTEKATPEQEQRQRRRSPLRGRLGIIAIGVLVVVNAVLVVALVNQ